MFADRYDTKEQYAIVTDNRSGFHVLLVIAAELGRAEPIRPLWVRSVPDQQKLDAVTRWFGVRRGLWQIWGKLAVTAGYEVFDRTIREIMLKAPVLAVTGTVRTMRDGGTVDIGETLAAPSGTITETLYCHQFASPKLAEAFTQWRADQQDTDVARELLDIGFAHGAYEVGRVMEAIAMKGVRTARKRSRERPAKALL